MVRRDRRRADRGAGARPRFAAAAGRVPAEPHQGRADHPFRDEPRPHRRVLPLHVQRRARRDRKGAGRLRPRPCRRDLARPSGLRAARPRLFRCLALVSLHDARHPRGTGRDPGRDGRGGAHRWRKRGAGAAPCRPAATLRRARGRRGPQDHLRAQDVRPGRDPHRRWPRHIHPDPRALHLHDRVRALRHGPRFGARLDADDRARRGRRVLSEAHPARSAGRSWL